MRPSLNATFGVLRRSLRVAPLLLFVYSLAAFPANENASSLFSRPQPTAKAALQGTAQPYLSKQLNDTQVRATNVVRANGGLLTDTHNVLELMLEPGLTVRVKKLNFIEREGMRIWTGSVQSAAHQARVGAKTDLSKDAPVDPENLAILIDHKGEITGTVTVDGQEFEIVPIERGQLAISKMNASTTRDTLDDSPPASGVAVPSSSRVSNSSASETIRVLTVYSNDVKKAYADPEALGTARFENFKAIAMASGVTVNYENAGVKHLAYDESTFPGCDQLSCLSSQLSEVRRHSESLQVELKAHVVMGLVANKLTLRGCGLASSIGATNVREAIAYACAGEARTYAHELGHVIGAHHGLNGRFTYALPYCQNSIQPFWQTIMAYCDSGGTVLSVFSNPERTYQGMPTGVVGQSDNARAINNWAPTIRTFFPPPDPAGAPIASGFVAIGEKDVPFSGEQANLDGGASRNPGLDKLKYEWTQVEGVPAATIDNSQAAVAVARFSPVSNPTHYRFRLTVRNATGAVDTTDASVRVYPRSPGVACENVPLWEPSQVYSVPGQQVSYQGNLYSLIVPAAGSHVQRAPAVWNGLVAPMNWRLIKACDSPQTLAQRIAAVDSWALANRDTPVTTGLQQQLGNLLKQQDLSWPTRSAAGLLRPIEFESKSCLVKDTVNPGQLQIREGCSEPGANRWLMDASGRLHSMETPDLCVNSMGNEQPAMLQPCADKSTPWVSFKEIITDYQAVSGKSLATDFNVNPAHNYGTYLANRGGVLISRTKTPTQFARYATFGDVPQDGSLLLAQAGATTLKVVAEAMGSEPLPGTAPPWPPQVFIAGPSTTESQADVVLDASRSSSINPGAGALAFTWSADPALNAQSDGALLRFTAPTVTSPTSYTLKLQVEDGQTQASEAFVVTVRPPGQGELDGELIAPAEMMEKTEATFTADVRSSGGSAFTYEWLSTGFTGTTGNTRSVKLKAPAVAEDTTLPLQVNVSDAQGSVLSLKKDIRVKRDTQLTGGTIVGASDIQSEQVFTQHVEIENPQNRPLTYAWTVTSPQAGAIEVIGPNNQKEITLKAPRLLIKQNGYVWVIVRDGVGYAALPNKTLVINPLVLPPLVGRLVMPSRVNVGEIFEPRVIIDNPQGRELSYRWWVNTASFKLLSSDPKQPVARIEAIKSSNNGGLVIEATVSDGSGKNAVYNTPRVVVGEPAGANPPQGQLNGPLEVVSGSSVSYNAAFTSPIGNPLRYAWVKGPLEGAVSDNASQTWTVPRVTADQVITVGVTVSDTAGNTNNKSVAVLIKAGGEQPPPAPVARINGPATVEAGKSLVLSASESTGDALKYSWLAPGLDPVTSTALSPSFIASSAAGTRRVELTVTDSLNRTATVQHTVVVTPANVPPEPPSGKIISADTVEGGGTILFSTDATSNPAGDELKYQWGVSPPLTGSLVDGPSLSLRASEVNVVTPATVELLVTDSKNAALNLRKTVNVLPSAKPVARVSGPNAVVAGKALALSATGSAGVSLRYAWQASGFIPASSAAVSPTFTAPSAPGPQSIVLTVTDSANRTASTTHSVTITPPAQSGDCAEPWVATKAYSVNNVKVSYDGYNYEVAHWTQNQRPDLNWVVTGSAKPWRRLAPCTP
ncbi:hypothetical protein DYL61_26845 [Pseudomonas nabeulensis]|uniref:Carbohydrate-binding protein n=1 Tax=Pseudomonas nabeulensis TaxID=2293833 RepID=A0A4Z0AL41_9PSED|nr:M12 family metallo-peptidase [Pseudomonas nabeulensis]TFY87101.1 hypothetical protein DYL61_26845 [Pseudomonas nabeulensis]